MVAGSGSPRRRSVGAVITRGDGRVAGRMGLELVAFSCTFNVNCLANVSRKGTFSKLQITYPNGSVSILLHS